MGLSTSRPALLLGLMLLGVLGLSAGTDQAVAVDDAPGPAGQGPLLRLQLKVDGGAFAEDEQRESAALAVLALVESLASSTLLVPVIEEHEGSPAATALRDWTPRAATATLVAEGPTVGVSLCYERCSELTVPTTDPTGAAAQLVAGIYAALDLPEAPPATRLVSDDYIRRILGRSAAVVLGWSPPPAASDRGHTFRDPVARAVYLDATVPLSRDMRGRARWAWGDREGAAESFQAGATLAPDEYLRRASAAIAWEQAGDPDRAMTNWRALPRTFSDDRVHLLRAEALATRDPEIALASLEQLHSSFAFVPAVHAVRADALSTLGRDEEQEQALARWAELDLEDPEPLRRRVELLLDQSRLDEAAVTAEALAERDPEGAEAIRLALALTRSEAEAVEVATSGSAEGARAVEARVAAEQSPRRILNALPGTGPAERLVRAEALLALGQPEDALRELEGEAMPSGYLARSEALRARIHERLGHDAERADAESRARWVEPAPRPILGDEG